MNCGNGGKRIHRRTLVVEVMHQVAAGAQLAPRKEVRFLSLAGTASRRTCSSPSGPGGGTPRWRSLGCGLPTVGRGLPTVGRGLPTVGRGLPTMGRELPTVGRVCVSK